MTGSTSGALIVHALNPGDHYSPRTGSAVPTVVHGIASAARSAGDRRHAVLVASGTYPDRYDSADAVEYRLGSPRTRSEYYRDLVLGPVFGRRPGLERECAPLAERVGADTGSIVLAHNMPSLPPLTASRNMSVLYAHNHLRSYRRRELQRILRSARGIVAVSESVASQLRRRLPAQLADRVSVVLNGVDCEYFTPVHRTRGEITRVVFVGRMVRPKGAHVVVEAARLLRSRRVRFVLVGSQGFDARTPLSSYEQQLRRQAESSGADVQFRPFVDRLRLPAVFAEADVLVVPSIANEGAPLTTAEGMACGLPVIASRVGGIPEMIGDSAVLVRPGSADELAQALEELIDDGERARRLGAAARRHAETHDWNWAWQRLRAVLDAL